MDALFTHYLVSQFQRKREGFQTEKYFQTVDDENKQKTIDKNGNYVYSNDKKAIVLNEPPPQFTIWSYIYPLLHLIVIGAAVFMSWNCEDNKKQDMGVRVLYAVLVLLFPYIYIPYYFFALKDLCKAPISTVPTNVTTSSIK